MKRWITLLVSILLAGCATMPAPVPTEALFHDQLFKPASERISKDDVFAITPEMIHYIHGKMAHESAEKGPQQALFDALYNQTQLKLEYDASVTRNAAQTFNTRSGNCLSLAIMTAALAKQVGLSVQYNRVYVDEMWSRSGDLYFSSGHVNLTLDKTRYPKLQGYDSSQSYTVDFLPSEQIAGQRSKVISELTVVAMYMNNRAAEALARGEVNDAYWWAREAIRQDPAFISAYNTLGVIYRRHGNSAESQQILSHALGLAPGSTSIIFNLAQSLKDLGRNAEADVLIARLEKLQPYPPYHFFKLGREAMDNGNYLAARNFFAREVERDPYNHEFQFWLASAYFRLGNSMETDKHLKLAMEYSTNPHEHDLYAAKRNRLKEHLAN
jgi:Tfp pilus assembly protein PilF